MRLSFCSANLRNTSPRCRLSSSYSVFSAALRDEHHMVFALPLRYGLGFPSRPSRTPFRVLWRLTSGSLRDGLLALRDPARAISMVARNEHPDYCFATRPFHGDAACEHGLCTRNRLHPTGERNLGTMISATGFGVIKV